MCCPWSRRLSGFHLSFLRIDSRVMMPQVPLSSALINAASIIAVLGIVRASPDPMAAFHHHQVDLGSRIWVPTKTERDTRTIRLHAALVRGQNKMKKPLLASAHNPTSNCFEGGGVGKNRHGWCEECICGMGGVSIGIRKRVFRLGAVRELMKAVCNSW
jgi:hypothetical protein